MKDTVVLEKKTGGKRKSNVNTNQKTAEMALLISAN